MHNIEAYVFSALDYDAETGFLRWKVGAGRVKAGQLADSIAGNGYVQVGIAGRRYLGHRLAWLIAYGRWPTAEIDHINGDRADNRLCNLREATVAQNRQNRKCRGAHWSRKHRRWLAAIRIDGKKKHLGSFERESDAADAYLAAKTALHPYCVQERYSA